MALHTGSARGTRLTRRFRSSLAVLVLVSVGIAGCAGRQPHPDNPAPDSASAPAGFEDYYSQVINWQPCEAEQVVLPMTPKPKDLEHYECATLEAPMNWDDPTSKPIELGIARYIGTKSDGSRAGTPLFFNLGGPGGGAVDSLSTVVGNVLTQQVVDSYQVVALDPRGVGTSTPIWCMTDQERDAETYREDEMEGMSDQELIAFAEKETERIGNQCLERNGEVLGFVDTDSAVRDFDMARAAMGANQMDYVGFSYGTALGAVYAELFPTHVGRFVLDGPLDTSLNITEVSAIQIEGMEKSLYHWIETCQAGSRCALNGDLESGKQQMIDFFDQVSQEPIQTSDPDRPLNHTLARTAVVGSLYGTDLYPLLTEGVKKAMDGDGSTLLFLADYFNDRDASGTYTSNSADAFIAVNSLDYEMVGTPEEWAAQSELIQKKFPVLGADYGLGPAGMDKWPVEPRVRRTAVTAPDAPEMLVIGTTNDPATPYVMAEAVASDLQNGILITVEGWDHTAYNRGASDCLRGAVDKFLLNGEVPEGGLRCDG